MRALVVFFVALIACKPKQPEARQIVPPTDQEAEAFAEEFVTHVTPCDATEIDRRIDSDVMLARTFAKRRITSREIEGFKRGFDGVGTLLCRQLTAQQNTIAHYLRLLDVDGVKRPLIRLIMDGAINYMELELDKRDGRVRIADISLYMAGERLSDILGKLIDLLMDANSATTMAMQTVNQHVIARDWKAAHEAFKKLPAEIRNSKPLRLAEIQMVSELGDNAAYLAAMDTYVASYPNDPSLALIQIDHGLLAKDYPLALRAINDLDRRVGGDPYLDVIRSDVLASEGKLAEAYDTAKRSADKAPELVAAWWALLTQQVANKRYAESIPTLERLRDQFEQDVTAETLGGDERFTALVESPEFGAWDGR